MTGKAPSASRPSSVTFLQTSDPHLYYDMLAHTSRTVRAFCHSRRYSYEAYIGVKRGTLPWHATYNRIFMLNELIDRGYRGWAIYLDADAFIPDQDFDLSGLLAEHAGSAAIMTLAGVPQGWWDVNAGVLLLNFGQVCTRSLIRRWKSLLDRIQDETLFEAEMWPAGFDDQSLLQIALRQRPRLREQIHFSSLELINSPKATFLRQFIRLMGSVEERTALIGEEVSRILRHASENPPR